MWRGSCTVKLITIITFLLLLISRLANAAHPLILGETVSAIICDVKTKKDGECPDTFDCYTLILIYTGCKFGADLLNYLRELPFAAISANSEKHISRIVYRHI